MVYDFLGGEVSDEHAHKALLEPLVYVHGDCWAALGDGETCAERRLNPSNIVICVPSMLCSGRSK